ncbi:MAG: metal ABC transporter substrate-binding protein [Limnothrix sp. BL-A-16]
MTRTMAERRSRNRGIGRMQWPAIALGLALLGTGCGTGSNSGGTTNGNSAQATNTTANPDRPKVVASGGVVCDLAQQIAGETIDLTCLVQPGRDPHTYEPTPSDRAAIESASLVLYGGYDFEGGLTKTLTSAPTQGPKVAIFEKAVPSPLKMAAHDHDHDHGHDHDHEDDHDHKAEAAAKPEEHDHDHDADPKTATGAAAELVADPHVWHSPQNGQKLTAIVAAQLSQLIPTQADRYQQAAQALTGELQALDRWIQTQVATVPPDRRRLITTHDALRYYAQAYGFEVKGALSGLSTEERPTPSKLAELVKLVKAANVPAIFAEASTNPKTIATVAREAGVQVAANPLYIDGPGAPGTAGSTYQTMLISNTCTVVNALGGQCEPKTAPLGKSGS